MEQVRKRSKKRDAILSCIRSTTCHPTADWVYGQLRPQIPDLSLGTVYRNIAYFKETGDIVSVGVIDGLEHYDGDTTPHSHLVCSRCGSVLDIPKMTVPQELLDFAEETSGAEISAAALMFYGVCSSCKSL